jgi:hydroxymethylglutaryl-CoA lyase
MLNERRYEQAATDGVDEINYVVVATEAFSRRNQGAGCDEAVATCARIAPAVRSAGLFTTVTVGAGSAARSRVR